jgi:hypothetical protein
MSFAYPCCQILQYSRIVNRGKHRKIGHNSLFTNRFQVVLMASARALGGTIPTSRTSYIGKGRGRGKFAAAGEGNQPGRQLSGVGA